MWWVDVRTHCSRLGCFFLSDSLPTSLAKLGIKVLQLERNQSCSGTVYEQHTDFWRQIFIKHYQAAVIGGKSGINEELFRKFALRGRLDYLMRVLLEIFSTLDED